MLDIPADWLAAMRPFLKIQGVDLNALEAFLDREYAAGQVFPPRHQIFRAFAATPFDDVRLLLLGQDPYHEAGQACGLAFSVPPDTKAPASLRNILKEYADDLQRPIPQTVDLSPWTRHGVMLLNTVLTVREGQAASHQNKGWEPFTDAAIKALSARSKPLVFLLWGGHAQKKKPLIDTKRHAVIMTAHPSPLSAYRGFFGSRPFTLVNKALAALGQPPIDWTL
ncbi:MAG: uracil-DNA glycosylase [Victivallales bacterium]|nr:uracil-DNA glycosylase [Victivallales bacterium]